MASFLKNLITFGAAGRVASAKSDLDAHVGELRIIESQAQELHTAMETAVDRLVKAKIAAVDSIKRIRTLANVEVLDRELSEIPIEDVCIELQAFDSASKSLTVHETAINAAKGLGTGASTALGAWALVATYGSASTGTAIATLSGAAATKATLAALGGGSLAAGGGGVAAGTAALGGLVAIPALVALAAFSHLGANKKIKELRAYSLEIIEKKEEVEKSLLIIDLAIKRSKELEQATISIEKLFSNEFLKVKRKLFPFGRLSNFFRRLRKIFMGKYFSESDLKEIAYIGGVASHCMRIIDTKVFDSDGSVTHGEIS